MMLSNGNTTSFESPGEGLLDMYTGWEKKSESASERQKGQVERDEGRLVLEQTKPSAGWERRSTSPAWKRRILCYTVTARLRCPTRIVSYEGPGRGQVVLPLEAWEPAAIRWASQRERFPCRVLTHGCTGLVVRIIVRGKGWLGAKREYSTLPLGFATRTRISRVVLLLFNSWPVKERHSTFDRAMYPYTSERKRLPHVYYSSGTSGTCQPVVMSKLL